MKVLNNVFNQINNKVKDGFMVYSIVTEKTNTGDKQVWLFKRDKNSSWWNEIQRSSEIAKDKLYTFREQGYDNFEIVYFDPYEYEKLISKDDIDETIKEMHRSLGNIKFSIFQKFDKSFAEWTFMYKLDDSINMIEELIKNNLMPVINIISFEDKDGKYNIYTIANPETKIKANEVLLDYRERLIKFLYSISDKLKDAREIYVEILDVKGA